MVKRLACAVAASLLILAGAGTASATLIATLSFTNPTGTAGPTDSIPVLLTLALDPSSDPLTTDPSGNVTSGLPADITPYLFPGLPDGVDATSATNSNLNSGLGCSGTFLTGCGGPPYDFGFNFNPPDLLAPGGFDLEPGNSLSFLFGTFTPTGGTAPPGTYTQPYAEIFIQVWDSNLLQDPNNPNSGWLHIADVPVADTSGGPSFTRTVNGETVPEPGTWMLMLAGLVLAGGAARRKTKTTAA